MTAIVLDASIVGTIVLVESGDTTALELEAILEGRAIIVPAHSPLEVASVLIKAARRLRMSPGDRESRLNRAERLLAEAAIQPAASSRTIFDLAMATGLTAYDAVYLELALRLDATLATNDDALIVAARTRGVPVVTTRP